MSILFVLLTFLVVISITYMMRREEQPGEARVADPWARMEAPSISRELGFEIPKDFCFHPGHTWVRDEGRQNGRIGMDALATKILGKIDRIEVAGLNRWVRQGQKLMTITREGQTIDLLSPVEGVITSVNHEVVKDPSLVLSDPYNKGWVCVVKSPEMTTNLKNLVRGPLIGPWLHNSVQRMNNLRMTANPAMAQDGGIPTGDMLSGLDPEAQRRLIQEVFLT